MEERYLICEDSLEGVFTGIYQAYLQKLPREQVHLCIGQEDEYRLFATYKDCPPDEELAAKVARTIMSKFGQEGYLAICRALASPEPDKGEAVYRMVEKGLSMKNPSQVMGNLKDPYIHRVFTLARATANEAHYHVEFIRFRELENGILYAPIGPRNNLITFVVPHFADRLPLENFVIHDEIRGIYAMHPAKREWYLVYGEAGKEQNHIFSEGEKRYSELFEHFFHTIAIEARKNLKLQRNMLPLRYRKYMTEFESCDK